jgi:hypothetical protein
MITLQEIINSLGSLSKEDQDFLFEILRKRREEETKQVRVHSLRGKYSNLATSSDDFASKKQIEEDIAAGIQQLENGEYTEYDENNLSTLITSIKSASLSR